MSKHVSIASNLPANGAQRIDRAWFGVRWVAFVITILFCFSQATFVHGQIFQRASTSKTRPKFLDLFKGTSANTQPPQVYAQVPTLETLIADINARALRIKQIDNRVTIAISGSPKITGTLQVEFPNRMRLKAGVMGVSEMGVDAGSNDQEFWVWSKSNLANPTMYFAKHDEFKTSQLRQQLPLEPKWLIDSLGVITIDPQGYHRGPFPDKEGRMRVYTVFRAADGSVTTRVLLVNASTGLIEQTVMYDGNNKRVAYANASQFKYDEKYNISLPQRVALHMDQPDGNVFSISVDLGAYSFNSLYGDPALLWTKPDPGSDPIVNLGRRR